MPNGLEYVEIEVKSVLNRVTGMPFRWSINPYRGCVHGCVFCLDGDTRILMADGTTQRLEELRVGDLLYATAEVGGLRSYVTTHVRAHWTSVNTAYRVALEDGTDLIASGDHRFLTGTGWKFVAGPEQGVAPRPSLTVTDTLLRASARALPPCTTAVDDPGSRLGASRADGLPGYARGQRAGRVPGRQRDGHAARSAWWSRDFGGETVPLDDRLRVVSVEPLGVRRLFDITTGTGNFIANGVISHNCYARRTHWFLEEDGVDRWATKVFVKTNAPEVLRLELSRHSWKREHVALGTATDPYQAIEARYRVTRRILETLREFHTPVGIVTRSPLIRRDLELLRALAAEAGVTVCVSVATTDAALARRIEPGVALPIQRLRTVRLLAEAGIRTGVLLAPILPGLTDAPESLGAVVDAARDHGAQFVGHTALHLGPVTRDAFMRFLSLERPELLPRYARMYTGTYAPSDYRAEVARTVEAEKARAGIGAARYLSPVSAAQQLPLGL